MERNDRGTRLLVGRRKNWMVVLGMVLLKFCKEMLGLPPNPHRIFKLLKYYMFSRSADVRIRRFIEKRKTCTCKNSFH